MRKMIDLFPCQKISMPEENEIQKKEEENNIPYLT
jgi:hypothetical protein